MSERKSVLEFYKSKNRPLILDGAIGSNLQNILSDKNNSMWSSSLNISDPAKVIELHSKYINAGANIITTNTFRTNPTAYHVEQITISNAELVKKSVRLAIQSRGENNILIAGSNAPAEDCYQIERTISHNELYFNHLHHIEYLWRAGVDFILNETFSHFDEIKIVCELCDQQNIPFIISLYLTDDLHILSGELLYDVIEYINQFSPIAIGINCISPATFHNIEFDKFHVIKWGFYLNCGSGKVTDEIIECGIPPKEYSTFIRNYLQYKPLFIGSCCGSSPTHTAAIKETFDEVYRN
jgi:homocysteine S-methyltransferase